MIVELSLVLWRKALCAVHLRELLEGLEHGVRNLLVRRVHRRSDDEPVRPDELALEPIDKDLAEEMGSSDEFAEGSRLGQRALTGKCLTKGATPLRFLMVIFVPSIALTWPPCDERA